MLNIYEFHPSFSLYVLSLTFSLPPEKMLDKCLLLARRFSASVSQELLAELLFVYDKISLANSF